MGCQSREFFSDDSSSSSLCEALLFATMCIIGLPVDVHVKDGSVYSGIFHTASVDRDFGIILKKARMTKKGKGGTNVGKEGLIDTLVIQSDDLVQVVAKGVMLPADGVSGNMTGSDEEAAEHTSSAEKPKGSMIDDKTQVNQSRQDGDDMVKGQTGDCRQKFEIAEEKIVEKVQGHSLSPEMDACSAQVEFAESAYRTSKPFGNGSYCAPESDKANDQYCEKSNLANFAATDATKVVDHVLESHNISAKAVPRSTQTTKNGKEFKLNPAAKVFSPSFVNPISVTPSGPTVPTVANMACLPNPSSVVPVAAIQSEVGFNSLVSRPSLPVKVAQYGNVTAANGGSGSQSTQPIVGQLMHRTQPLRFATHYNPVLPEPTYLQTSSPAVVVGRSGQLVYVHPVTHDLVHGATTIAPVPPHPLSNMNHVQFPKQQGGTVGQVMPLCVPPLGLATGQQPFALQNHIPVLQPSRPANRPIPVLAPNGFYASKF